MEFTKKRLRACAREKVKSLEFSITQTAFADSRAELEEELELARIALASLEAEAVAYVDPIAFHNFSVYRSGETDNKRMGREWMWANPDAGLIPVYAAPQTPVAVLDFGALTKCIVQRLVDYGAADDDAIARAEEFVYNACRAAMLKQPSSIQGRDDAVSDSEIKQPSSNVQLFGVTEQLEPASQTYRLRDGLAAIRKLGPIDAEKIFAERDALNAPDCWCRTCRPVTISDMRFVVCPECGNKRCPHANDHQNACTGSNEPGQEGSAYTAAPQQEVK